MAGLAVGMKAFVDSLDPYRPFGGEPSLPTLDVINARAHAGDLRNQEGRGALDGMHTHRFWGRTDSDLAVAHTYEYEFPPRNAICQVSLTEVNERDDNTGAMVAFVSYTYLDEAGEPHRVEFWDAPTPVIVHSRLVRIEWYLRIWEASATGLLNVFYWPSVS